MRIRPQVLARGEQTQQRVDGSSIRLGARRNWSAIDERVAQLTTFTSPLEEAETFEQAKIRRPGRDIEAFGLSCHDERPLGGGYVLPSWLVEHGLNQNAGRFFECCHLVSV